MRKNLLALGVAVLAVVAAAAAANGSPARSTGAKATLTYCTDATYPPEEFFQGSKIVGSDIDIGNAIAKRLGMKPVWKNTGFDSIIPALLARKCDAIISGMNDTAERRKQVDFVDYLKVGQSITVKKGNPKHVSSLASLSGLRVSVESGTTNRQFLKAESEKLVQKGKKAISIVTFPKDTDAFAALLAGRVDAYYADAPPAAYYAKKNSTKVEIAGNPISPFAIGIAIRKGDPLRPRVQKAVAYLYSSGQMKKIVAKWGMADAVVLLKK